MFLAQRLQQTKAARKKILIHRMSALISPLVTKETVSTAKETNKSTIPKDPRKTACGSASRFWGNMPDIRLRFL
jgi:hypothetical protein